MQNNKKAYTIKIPHVAVNSQINNHHYVYIEESPLQYKIENMH